jgi:ubiquinone biosynthesis protein UbiJ
MWDSVSKLTQRPEATLNRWISGSSAARDALKDLEGRSMIVDIDKTSLRFRLSVDAQRVHLGAVDTQARADIVIRAGPFDLAALLRAHALSEFSAGRVEFRGNLRVAEQFARVLRLARPQLEDELAGWIGGIPARVVAQAGEAAFSWGRRTANAFELNATEYLQCESRTLPFPVEVTQFARSVEQLRDDVERVSQRVERLARRLSIADSL